MRLATIVLRRLVLPLVQPYRLSNKVLTEFRPIIAEILADDGGEGWGETIISAGYSIETPEAAWAHARTLADRLAGQDMAGARAALTPDAAAAPSIASIFHAALDMIERKTVLTTREAATIELLEPIQAKDLDALPAEIDALIGRGYRTLKVKVGFDVAADLARVRVMQRAAAGRAELRLDANQGYSAEQGRRFVGSLDPAGLQLFEQPCAKADWAANAAVAEVSKVPVMMDESIYGMADIDRAAQMRGVGFVKLKMKKMGSLDGLLAGLARIRRQGMRPVLGDGVATDISCWQEACAARAAIDNAGEMNGFLKLKTPLFANPMPVAGGAIRLPAGYWPEIDRDALEAHTVERVRAGA